MEAGTRTPGLIDKNVREMDEQFRAAEGLVSIDDIEKLMKIYKAGKAPLSLALGFGEVTIPSISGRSGAIQRILRGFKSSVEKRVIDLVVNTFGMYGGKVLEKITHNEALRKEADPVRRELL